MRDADDPKPSNGPAAEPTAPRDATPDPADWGTAYGMELSIAATPKLPAAQPDDDPDPLSWIRRWLDQHKTP